MSAADDLERIGDHAENIMLLSEEAVDQKLPVSNAAIEEVTEFYNMVDSMLEKAIRAFELEDRDLASQVIASDDIVDEQEKFLRKEHIERINKKKCYPGAGVIYLDLISNLARVADHSTGIAEIALEN